MQTLLIFLLWMVLLVLGSRLVDRLLAEIFPRGKYRWIIWPGVIIHELSHAIVGKLMGAKIKDISLFSKTGGSVTHTSPRIPIIGMPLTSIAPLFGCTLALLGVMYIFGYQDSLTSFSTIPSSFVENYKHWQWWVFVYLAIAIACPIAPSNHDFKNAWLGIFLIILTLGVLFYFHIGESYLTTGLQSITSLFILGATFELLATLIVFPIWVLRRRKIF